MGKYLFIIPILFLIGCSTTKELTEIKPHVIYPATIEDTIYVSEKADTVIIGVDVVKTDTVTLVKYFPKLEKFYVWAKPDSIVRWDTVKTTQTIEKIIETSWLEKAGLIFLGLIAGVGILLLIKR